jgi:hypothetical protein
MMMTYPKTVVQVASEKTQPMHLNNIFVSNLVPFESS